MNPKPGDGVITSAVGNAWCEAAIAPARELIPFPDAMDFIEAATFKVSYTTSYHALVQRGRLQAGETVLVLGAAGGVGYAAIQIAKALGARVIASASSVDKRELALQAKHGMRAHVGRIFPLAQFAEAMHLAASGTCLGRIVLAME